MQKKSSKKPLKSAPKDTLSTVAEKNDAPLFQPEQVAYWQQKIKEAKKIYEPYHQVVKKARSCYKMGADKEGGELSSFSDGGSNIFWSSVETQKPFLYFKQPKPYIERAERKITPAESVAAKILERALIWDLRQFDFDSVIKYARNDYLISGMGLLWESYEAQFETVLLQDNQSLTLKTDEKVVTKYVDPTHILLDQNHTGIFEEITWMARLHIMTATQAGKNFAECEALLSLISGYDTRQKEEIPFEVYEIWDKQTRKVYWMTFSLPDTFLKVQDDPLKLSTFFPMPKPCFATLTNDSLIPLSDYQVIEKMLSELKGITERMRLLMQALKVSGAYDGSFARLRDIFDKDVTLVALPDFERLKEAGGLKGVIDFIPIDQFVNALKLLAERRERVKEELFEITGVSDIMRGSSSKAETATAVEKKTNFGTLRNQDRQNDIQRFILDCYRIKAELICEHFDKEKLKTFVSVDEGYTADTIDEAVEILKSDKLRHMILSIETESFFNQEERSKKTVLAVEVILKLIQSGLTVVSLEPKLLPLYKQMIKETAASLEQARPFENTLDATFLEIEKALTDTQKDQSLATSSALAQNLQKNARQLMIEEQKRALEQQELKLKAQELAFKERELFYKHKKAELDFQKELVRQNTEKQPALKAPVLPKKTGYQPFKRGLFLNLFQGKNGLSFPFKRSRK